ncbi:hypothetical protein ZWY2020_045904 [Hordeum vulgare]|nr:hypothetical protein ZWY2020_045904 [Hordeum vulgare]
MRWSSSYSKSFVKHFGSEKRRRNSRLRTCVGRGHGHDEAAGSTRLVEPAACDVNHQDESELGAVGCELRRDLQTQSVSLLKDSDSRRKHNDLFNVEGWNCYSTLKSYKLDDIWRRMLKEIYSKDKKEFDAEKMTCGELQDKLKELLKTKRYLIILDDVWTAEDFRKIKEVLVDAKLGSRIIITTRSEEVASIAPDDCRIKVEPLEDDDAWRLFCRKAFPCTENHICPLALQECGLPIETVPDSIGELFNLRYLALKKTNVEILPKSVVKLHNLETLNLQVRGSKVLIAKLANLSQLRALYITGIRSIHCAQLCNSLSKMQQLSVLGIEASNEDEVLQLETLTLSNRLKKLTLSGRISEGTLKSPFFSTNGDALYRIYLRWSHLAENPVPRLSELSNLTVIDLGKAYTGQELTFQPEWFPNVKILSLHALPHVNKICIHEGALVLLEELLIRNLAELRDIPAGLEHLKSLKEAWFLDMHPDFEKSFPVAKLEHVPKVYFSIRSGEA